MNLDTAQNIYRRMVNHQFLMSLVGPLSHEMLKSVIRLTERKLDKMEAPQLVKKRMFHFMIECAQNLYNDSKNEDDNLLLIGKNGDFYVVYMGYLCSANEIVDIKEIMDRVNQMERDEIKNVLYNELRTSATYNKKSLLISFLDIAKRTREKVNYEIVPAADNNSFLCLKASIYAG